MSFTNFKLRSLHRNHYGTCDSASKQIKDVLHDYLGDLVYFILFDMILAFLSSFYASKKGKGAGVTIHP
jgi:hypothetical protein